jgi:alpha-1,2-mannosyltransferase
VRAWAGPLLLAAALLVAGVVAAMAEWHVGADSAAYRAGAIAVLKGDQLYSPNHLSAAPSWDPLPFTYPPAAALLFAPLAAVPMGVAWGLIGAASILVIAVLVRSITPMRRTLITLAVLALEPVWKTLFLGQINLILVAMIAVDVLVLKGRKYSGVLIGIAAAVKLVPLIFVAHLLLIGRRAQAARALGTFAGLQALMFLIIPRDAAWYWTHGVTDPERIGGISWIFNQSLNGLVLRLSDGASWSAYAALGVGALLAVPAVVLVRRLSQAGRPVEALLVTGFLSLLISPVSWSHHWVWAVPLVILLVARAQAGLAGWWPVIATYLVFASCVIMIVPNGGDVEFRWNGVEALFGSTYLLVPLVAGVLAWRGLDRRRVLV